MLVSSDVGVFLSKNNGGSALDFRRSSIPAKKYSVTRRKQHIFVGARVPGISDLGPPKQSSVLTILSLHPEFQTGLAAGGAEGGASPESRPGHP